MLGFKNFIESDMSFDFGMALDYLEDRGWGGKPVDLSNCAYLVGFDVPTPQWMLVPDPSSIIRFPHLLVGGWWGPRDRQRYVYNKGMLEELCKFLHVNPSRHVKNYRPHEEDKISMLKPEQIAQACREVVAANPEIIKQKLKRNPNVERTALNARPFTREQFEAFKNMPYDYLSGGWTRRGGIIFHSKLLREVMYKLFDLVGINSKIGSYFRFTNSI